MSNILKPQDIYVVGYFGHENIGDEQYKITYEYVLKNFLPNFNVYNLQFIDCDHISDTTFLDSDIILLGGGDVLNDYFLDEIILKFTNKPNKILAVSVGIPYTDILVNTNKLHIIDYIFVRTQQDVQMLQKHVSPERVLYIPDLSIFLSTLTNTNQKSMNYNILEKKFKTIQASGQKIIALTLSKHIHDTEQEDTYKKILVGFAQFVKYLVTFGYHVVLLPFNTNSTSNFENDIIIHNDLMNLVSHNSTSLKNITNITCSLTSLETFSLYNFFYATIPMRFHATLFSIFTNTPMMPVFTTRKIKNVLLDIDWTIGYQLECNTLDIPTNIDIVLLIDTFRNLIECHTVLENKLLTINKGFNLENYKQLYKLVSCDYPKTAFSLDTNTALTKAKEIYNKIQNISKKYGCDNFKTITDPVLKKLITQSTSYFLTDGVINSPYNFGLSTKMFNIEYDHLSEWCWVIQHHTKLQIEKNQHIYNNSLGLFNINYMDQIDYSGAHRSGWQFVYNNINDLHNESSDLYLDLYLDRTFHWNKDINKELGIIPYKHNWVGFVHHTFDTTFSQYNNHNLLKNPEFIQSLETCKGLFVLSNTLRLQFLKEFEKCKISVPVFSIVHPTEIPVPQFSFNKFLANTDKRIINIGGWLRNIYTFYNLSLPKSTFTNTLLKKQTFTIRKVALKGHSMDNYFPTTNISQLLQEFLITLNVDENPSQNASQDCSDNFNFISINNNWFQQFYNQTKNICDSVDILDKLDNNEYDKLLTENIVFIHLIDASAVNTLIECIVRNTPIIINNHPAVVELLGKNYPLYFTSTNDYIQINKQVSNLLSNTNNIKKAYTYMQTINNSIFDIKTFKQQFVKYIQQIHST